MGIEPTFPGRIRAFYRSLNYGTLREANLTDAVLSRAHLMVRFGK